LMKRAAVNADATVVNSLITTLGGALLPSTVIRAIAEVSPRPLFVSTRLEGCWY